MDNPFLKIVNTTPFGDRLSEIIVGFCFDAAEEEPFFPCHVPFALFLGNEDYDAGRFSCYWIPDGVDNWYHGTAVAVHGPGSEDWEGLRVNDVRDTDEWNDATFPYAIGTHAMDAWTMMNEACDYGCIECLDPAAEALRELQAVLGVTQ